jgi:hypothetical protein
MSILIALKGEVNERWEARLQRIYWYVSVVINRLLSELQSVSDSNVKSSSFLFTAKTFIESEMFENVCSISTLGNLWLFTDAQNGRYFLTKIRGTFLEFKIISIFHHLGKSRYFIRFLDTLIPNFQNRKIINFPGVFPKIIFSYFPKCAVWEKHNATDGREFGYYIYIYIYIYTFFL